MPDRANNTSNVSTGSPEMSGYAFQAPVETTMPKDALTELPEAWNILGYISDEGVKNGNSPESKDIKDWGGTTVLSVQTSKNDIWKFKMIESKNLTVLKTVYGKDNVSGDFDKGIVIKANSKQLDYNAYVFDMVMSEDVKKRVAIPKAKVTEIGDITYANEATVAYDVTLTCAPDAEGNTHYEYIQKAQTTASGSEG